MKGDCVVRLTDKNVRTLPAVAGRRTEYTDALLTRFQLRVKPSGHRSYSVIYGSGAQRRRFTVGSADTLTLAQARDKARQILAQAELGDDPQAEKIAARRAVQEDSLGKLAIAFFEARPRKRGGTWRPTTEASYRHAFQAFILPAFGDRHPDSLERTEVVRFLDAIARRTPVMANRVMEAFRRCYTWALSRGYVKVTPFVGIERPAQATRGSRTFSNDEIRAMFAALPGSRLEDVVALIWHTATRSEETRAMRWRDVDFERRVWTIPPEAAKTGQIKQAPHVVPLSGGALAVLERIAARREQADVVDIQSGEFVFPAQTRACPTCGRAGHMDKPNKMTAALKRKLGMERETGFLHHIRRTVADRLKTDLGVAPFVVEAILGHALQGLAAVYMPSDPMQQKREALQAWSDHLEGTLRIGRDTKAAVAGRA